MHVLYCMKAKGVDMLQGIVSESVTFLLFFKMSSEGFVLLVQW